MSISTQHTHLTPYLVKHRVTNVLPSNRISFEEILQDFNSLEDLAITVDLEGNGNHTENKPLTSEYEKFVQMQDFRRPKMQENNSAYDSKYRKLNRSYSMHEMRKMGVELESLKRRSSQYKFQDHTFILSEFIL